MILVTHASEERDLFLGPELVRSLQGLDHVELNGLNRPMNTDEILAWPNCRVVVAAAGTPGEARLFEAHPSLVAFVRGHVDVRNVHVGSASNHGVVVVCGSAGFGTAVAELILGQMIDLARGISLARQHYTKGAAPDRRLGLELAGAKLGIIGFGHIGQRLGDIAVAIGMNVLVFDPKPFVQEETRIVPVSFEDLLSSSDFVVPLAPATPETANLIDARAFARMKPTAFLVNASRGELVDEAALAVALGTRQIAGAALDVGSAEGQMPPTLFADRPDVIMTPHIGGLTVPAVRHQASELLRHVSEIVAGRMPAGAINPESAHRLRAARR